MNQIDFFRGKYYFLSNYYTLPKPITYEGLVYTTSEAAYQAAKTKDIPMKRRISAVNSPAVAKKLGRRINVIKNWDEIKYDVMNEIVRLKFEANPALKQRLLQTGDALLIEGNTWNDKFWGMIKNSEGEWVGENNLGKILMNLRDQWKEKDE